MSIVLITGSCGLVGSDSVEFFTSKGFDVVGIDNINDYYDTKIKYVKRPNFYSFLPLDLKSINFKSRYFFYKFKFSSVLLIYLLFNISNEN